MSVIGFGRAVVSVAEVGTPEGRRRSRIAIALVAGTLVLGTLALFDRQDWAPWWVLLVYFALGLVAAVTTGLRSTAEFWERFGGVAALVIVSGLVALTGGANSPYLILYLIEVLFGAVFHPGRRVAAVGAGILVAVALITVATPGVTTDRIAELTMQGGILAMLTVIVHGLVSRLHTTTDELELSRQRYRSLVDHNPDAVHVFDDEGRFLFANPAALAMSGHSPQDVRKEAPMTVDALICPELVDYTWEKFRATVDGHPQHFETAITRTDGGRVELQVSTIPMVSGGKIVGVFSVSKDITRRQHIEQRLRERASQQAAVAALGRRALEHSDLDELLDEVVVLVRRTLGVPLCALFQYRDPATAVLRAGSGWSVDGRDAASVTVPLDSGFVTGLAHQRVDPVVIGPGTGDLPPLLVDHGVRHGALVQVGKPTEPFGVLGAFTIGDASFDPDDASFLQTVASLLAGVLERNEAQQRLLQAQRMQAVGQLAGGIAHDFNNLLTALIGNQELIVPEIQGNQQASAHLREALEAARRAQALVDQLLTFSRGRLAEPALAEVDEAVDAMRGLLARLLPPAVELRMDLDAPGVVAAVDVNQLEQIVLNLMVNARDAMPDGGVLRIDSTQLELDEPTSPDDGPGAGRFIRLRVADTGVGMSPSTRSRLFEPFFTTKPAGKGTGLGLPTVYGIVKAAGGQIVVDSEEGRGTTVSVFLPAATTAEDRQSPERAAIPSAGQRTVLVVEDQAAVRSLVAEILRQQGLEVLEAPNGLEALTVAADHDEAIDLLITDVVMPQLDGPGLARQLRESCPRLAVLYMSGYNAHPDLSKPGIGPRPGFLPKPFGVAELLEKVRGVLSNP